MPEPHKPTVLIVDDDLTLLNLLRMHVSSAGLAVQVAADAEVAIRSVLEHPPDLILLDLGLPYLDGMEVLAALKSDPASKDIPVIVFTGHDNEREYLQAQNLGADGFLRKPIDRTRLVNEIFSRIAQKAARKLSTLPPE